MNTKVIVLVVWALACVAVMSGCGRKYTATSMLRIKAEEPAVLAGPARVNSAKEFETYKEKQRMLLMLRPVLMAALRKPEVAKLPSVQTETQSGDAVKWLEGIVKVEFPGRAEIMAVSCTTNDPHEATVLTNAVVDAYMIEIVNAERTLKRRRLDELETLIGEKEMEVRRKQAELDKLTSIPSVGNAKAPSSRPDSADAARLRPAIKSLQGILKGLGVERDKLQIALKMLPRVTVIEPAEEPSAPNKHSL